MDEKRLQALKPNYDFSQYEKDLQPTLFEVGPGEPDQTLSFEQVRRREAVAVTTFQQKLKELILLTPEEREKQGYAGVPDFYEIYMDLLESGWPARIAAYIAWCSVPRARRYPKTQDELANLLGLTSDRQFTKWRRNNPALDALIARLQMEPLLKHRADVFDALVQSASTPDYKNQPDRKLFLEITGDYIPSSKVEAELKRSAEDNQVTDHEERLIEQLIDPKLEGNAHG